ncbi:hypothetical protein FQA39_LY04528 [Lamprigera yunnana]|nr:hypothetical protein FQA39_LY04528 [Lamprigera yunnana]
MGVTLIETLGTDVQHIYDKEKAKLKNDRVFCDNRVRHVNYGTTNGKFIILGTVEAAETERYCSCSPLSADRHDIQVSHSDCLCANHLILDSILTDTLIKVSSWSTKQIVTNLEVATVNLYLLLNRKELLTLFFPITTDYTGLAKIMEVKCRKNRKD